MKRNYWPFLFAGLFAVPHAGIAADQSTSTIPSVVVSATRSEQSEINVPARIDVITREDIKASQASNIADLLRGRAGLQITDLRGDGASVTISLRGFDQTANANVLVLVDGRRLNHSDTRAPDISHISLSDVERIEITHGSASTLYGDQAVGGVVNIITRKPLGKQIDLVFDVGSYSRRGVRFNAGNKLDNGFAYRLSAQALRSSGYRDHSARDYQNLSATLAYAHNTGDVFIDLQQVRDNLELPGALVQSAFDADRRQINPGFINDFSDSDISMMRLGVRQLLNDQWSFEGELTRRDTDEKLIQSFQNNPSPPGGNTRRDALSFNPRLIGNFETSHGESQVTLGLDIEKTDFDLFVPFVFFGFPGAVDRSNDQHTKAVYAQGIIPLSNKLSLTVGGRYASVDNKMVDVASFPAGIDVDDNVFVKSIGLNYRADKHWRLYTRLDENFRFAKVDEITGAPAGTILKTQEGLTFDMGVEWSGIDRFFSLGVYWLKLDDEIYFDPTVGLFGANVNLDKTLRQGLIISGGLDVSRNMQLSADYTVTRAKFKAGGLDGNTVSGVAPYIATFRVNYQPTQRWNVLTELQLISSKYAQGDNLNSKEKAPGYGVLNFTARYEVRNWELAFRMNNVTDKEYSEFIADGFTRSYQPSPERNIAMSVGYHFN
ncbi:MAG: TonB-dependent receptor [Gammaproteobacteria bacterium]|nr:MAG: TonB-dependent receptor [Gammaproteobacteria bacterium]